MIPTTTPVPFVTTTPIISVAVDTTPILVGVDIGFDPWIFAFVIIGLLVTFFTVKIINKRH